MNDLSEIISLLITLPWPLSQEAKNKTQNVDSLVDTRVYCVALPFHSILMYLRNMNKTRGRGDLKKKLYYRVNVLD